MTSDEQEWSDLTAARLSALGVERERCCVTLPELFQRAKSLPAGLTLEVATDWFWRKPSRVRRAHYDYLLKLWKSQPDEPDNRIPLIEEMYLALTWHRDRTGVPPITLLEEAEDVPEGLTGALVQRWLHNRRPVKSVKSHYYLYVINLWASLPDAAPEPAPEGDFVAITQAMLQRLQDERARTGVSITALLTGKEDLPEGLTPAIAASWVHERGPTKSARPEHTAYVLRLWEDEPDDPDPRVLFTETMRQELQAERMRTGVDPAALVALAGPGNEEVTLSLLRRWLQTRRLPKSVSRSVLRKVLALWRSLPDDPRVPLTPALRRELRQERDRTGVSPRRLLSGTWTCPPDLKPSAVEAWLKKDARTIRVDPDHLEFVLKSWQHLPDSPFVPLIDALRAALEAEKRRTGIAAGRLLQLIDPLPEGLTTSLVNSWTYRKRKRQHARRDHLEAVLAAWKALPDNPYVLISDEARWELLAHKERTALGPAALLEGSGDNAPSRSTVEHWLSARTRKARKSQLALVRRLWTAAPDNPEAQAVKLDDALVEELRHLRQTTGLGPHALLRASKDRPDGLTSRVIARWLKREATHADPAHLDYVLQRWRTAPTRVPLTAAMRADLKGMRERTGIGPKELLKEASDPPPGLRPTTIDGWLRGATKQVYQEHYDHAVRLWRRLESNGVTGTWIVLDAERLDALKRERQRSGMGPTRLLRHADDLPAGLTANRVTNWLMGQNRKARRDHYDFVLALWKSLPDKT